MRRLRRSVRFRLAALLAVIFLLFGSLLLALSYALVRSNLGPGVDRPGRAFAVALIREARAELREEALRKLTVQYLIALAGMTVVSSGLGWLVAGRMLRPVSDITAAARRVSQENLHERIALDGPDDELKQLGDTFDSMLGRLEAAFERQAAFIRNASHELRTPLAVIQAEADVTLVDNRNDIDALRRSLSVVRDSSQRSERLIKALLTLARADRADRPRSAVDLGELCREELDKLEPGGLSVGHDHQPVTVIGDLELLRTMIANLLDNAVRHNLHDGWMHLAAGRDGDEARIEVSNAGPVIDEAAAASLTEPFRRLARTGDGLGLGLSIAASVAAAHGGRLDVAPLRGGGLGVVVRLPATDQP